MERNDGLGVVFLVGAGPGDPELITARGMSRLNICDAVVYDSLASRSPPRPGPLKMRSGSTWASGPAAIP